MWRWQFQNLQASNSNVIILLNIQVTGLHYMNFKKIFGKMENWSKKKNKKRHKPELYLCTYYTYNTTMHNSPKTNYETSLRGLQLKFIFNINYSVDIYSIKCYEILTNSHRKMMSSKCLFCLNSLKKTKKTEKSNLFPNLISRN